MKIDGRALSFGGRCVSSALALSLAACGGGGNPSAPAQPPANQPPAFSSAASVSVEENVAAVVYQAVAADPNGDALTYSIVGGVDARRFTLTAAGQLRFVDAPNFDLPVDADQNNAYEVQIGASDGKASTTLAVTVTVTNSREGVAVHRIATGFTDPVAMAPKDAQMMLVAEKAGAIYSLDIATGVKTLLLRIGNVGGVGVVAMSYGPNTAVGSAGDGSFFVMYTTENGFLVINHFARDVFGQYYSDSIPVLVTSAPNYTGGGALIYTSGSLFAATGDAGGSGDPSGSAQSDASWLGKLVRIVPNADPYAGASAVYYAVSKVGKGLHRPHGGTPFSTGILFADRGQDFTEELNFFASADTGLNFGWPYKEGVRSVSGSLPAGLTEPVLEYYHSGGFRTGRAIVAGARGPAAVASLRDQFLFADESGAIFTITATQIAAGKTLASDGIERRDADFAPDAGTLTRPVAIESSPAGAVFILDANGDVFRVDAR